MSLVQKQCLFFHETSKDKIAINAEKMSLCSFYPDQISAYRARRSWIGCLAQHFSLEETNDYCLEITFCQEKQRWTTALHFRSPCARYSFWRLINSQAEDAAQDLLESAGYETAPKLGKKKSSRQGSLIVRLIGQIQHFLTQSLESVTG